MHLEASEFRSYWFGALTLLLPVGVTLVFVPGMKTYGLLVIATSALPFCVWVVLLVRTRAEFHPMPLIRCIEVPPAEMYTVGSRADGGRIDAWFADAAFANHGTAPVRNASARLRFYRVTNGTWCETPREYIEGLWRNERDQVENRAAYDHEVTFNPNGLVYRLELVTKPLGTERCHWIDRQHFGDESIFSMLPNEEILAGVLVMGEGLQGAQQFWFQVSPNGIARPIIRFLNEEQFGRAFVGIDARLTTAAETETRLIAELQRVKDAI